MADTAHFDYQGKAVLDLKRLFKSEARDIEIQKIVNLIPIQIHCTQGGQPMVVVAYMDYSTNTVEIPPSSLQGIDSPDHFREVLVQYVQNVVLPQNVDQYNLSPDEMEVVHGELDDNESPERHHQFARNSGVDHNAFEEDEEDGV